MSARSVCSGTRPSRYHSVRAISAPPRRPATFTRMPRAPIRIEFCTPRFIARRNETRRSSCWAIDFGDELGVQFRLADLDDVEVQLTVCEVRQLLAQRLDIRALLADDDTRTRRVDRHAALLVRTFDDDLRHTRLLGIVLVNELTHLDVFKQQVAVFLACRRTSGCPRCG